jgi:hypothetical protein
VGKHLPNGSDGLSDGSVSLHLLTGDQVSSDKHSQVVPDLHHLLVAPSSESESSVTAAEEALSSRSFAIGRGAVLSTFNVELVRLGGSSRRRRAESASGEEQRPDGVGGRVGVRRGVLVEVTSGGKDVETLLVRLCESLLSLEETGVDGNDAGVVLSRVVDRIRVSERGLGVEQVVGSGSKGDPLSVWQELSHVDAQLPPGLLDRGRHSRLPFVKGGPGRLDGSDDALLEVSRVLLHDDNRLLQGVLLLDLLLELLDNGHVDRERVLLGADLHRGVVDSSDSSGEVADRLGGELSLLGDGSGELSSVVLDVLDVSLDLGSELLEVLNNRGFDGSSEGRVRVGDHTSLVPDGVEDILHAALAQELVSRSEGDLDDGAKLGELLGGVGFDIGDTLKVGWRGMSIPSSDLGSSAERRTNQHFDNLLPSGESLDENVAGLELMRGSVLLDLMH